VIFGILPATNAPDSAYGGLTLFEVYLPVMIAFSLATMSLIALPIPLA
jgi:ABC-2 type transport system permease protein